MNNNIIEVNNIIEEINLTNSDFVPFKKTLQIESLLSSSNSTEMLNYHYSLFKIKEDAVLYMRIRSSFEERPKEIIEPFLLNKLDEEKDISLKADVIQLLGSIKSTKILPFIYKNITSPIRDIRYRCIIVLGWVGNSKDLPLLNENFATLGTKRIAKSPSPSTNSILAPGQCMILNKIPIAVKEIDTAPEINANCFILI